MLYSKNSCTEIKRDYSYINQNTKHKIKQEKEKRIKTKIEILRKFSFFIY